MNKEKLEEALKVVKEPIIVNSIEYKYFDRENYNKLVNVIDYCNYLNDNVKPYVEAQYKEIERLNNIINKAVQYINEMCLASDGYASYGDDLNPEHIVNILKGESNGSTK